MEEKNLSINNISEANNSFIKNISDKYKDNIYFKIIGKELHYINNITIIQFFCVINQSTEINPFNQEIFINFEFRENDVPYIQILNDFISPTLNDGRNIFFCLTNKHSYIFNKNNNNEFLLVFDELIEGINNFLLCLKENMEINIFIFYGEYKMNRIYLINDFLLNKNKIKVFRIIHINGKNEEMKYIVITQLFFLIFKPLDDNMSLAELEDFYCLKDIIFSFNISYKKNSKTFNLNLFDENINKKISLEFIFFESIDKSENSDESKYYEFKNIIYAKQNEINFKRYQIIITNYKPIFLLDAKKINSDRSLPDKYMYGDYKLYISYFEKLINYYKENKEEKIKERVKKYVNYLNYCCTDFITFNNSNQDEIKYYQNKIVEYISDKNII